MRPHTHPNALVIENNKFVQSLFQSNFSFKKRSDNSGMANMPVLIMEAKDKAIKKYAA
jgi:hypothetical protein